MKEELEESVDEVSPSNEKEKSVDEISPLIKKENITRKILIEALKTISYFSFAVPTAVFNALAALIHGDELEEINSPADFYEVLRSSSGLRLSYGIGVFIASESVLFFLNKRYLLFSGKAVCDLIRRDILTLLSWMKLVNLDKHEKASLIENGFFIWSFGTSLIFAEIGGKALNIFGLPGKIIGFLLSLAVYFATRYSTVMMFINDRKNESEIRRKHYLDKLLILDRNNNRENNSRHSISINLDKDNDDPGWWEEPLKTFLQNLDAKWDELPKSEMRQFVFNYLSPALGWSCASLSLLPIALPFMPVGVEGTEELFHCNIGANHDYQNIASFSLGSFLVLLTLFFYALNIKELPKHLLKTLFYFFGYLQSAEIKPAIKILLLTVLAFGVSYCGGIGFSLLAELVIANHYLSYLPEAISGLIPEGLFASVLMMFWSHLQDLVNQNQLQSINGISKININSAEVLLSQNKYVLLPAKDKKNIEKNELEEEWSSDFSYHK